MVNELFDFLIQIPESLSNFGSWLTTPLDPDLFNISPLGLLGVGGLSFVIVLISVHVVRLFVV